jgi:hypothetical protein
VFLVCITRRVVYQLMWTDRLFGREIRLFGVSLFPLRRGVTDLGRSRVTHSSGFLVCLRLLSRVRS